jgi:hypothetical protein
LKKTRNRVLIWRHSDQRPVLKNIELRRSSRFELSWVV